MLTKSTHRNIFYGVVALWRYGSDSFLFSFIQCDNNNNNKTADTTWNGCGKDTMILSNINIFIYVIEYW